METETFECSHKVSYASKEGGGKYSIYVTKDDGTDMTIYGEALGAEGWAKGARLKITAEKAKKSKNEKWYQTAKSVELLEGEVSPVPASTQGAVARDPAAQWKEKYRLTMSNLLAAWLGSGKEITPEVHKTIDLVVKDILNIQYNGDDTPF